MSKDHFDLPENLTQNTRDAWYAAVEKSLGGKSVEASLASKTYDGITIKPLYDQLDVENNPCTPLQRPAERKQGDRPWDILQLVDIPDTAAANEQIKSDLAGGASGLYLSISADIPYGAGALSLHDGNDVSSLLKGADLEGKTLYLSNGYDGLVTAAAIVNYLQESSIENIKGSFGFDPLTLFAAMGAFPDPVDDALANWTDAAHHIKAASFAMKPFIASGRIWQQAGASEAMELGFTLASALYYVRSLNKAGFSIKDSFDAVDLGLTVSGEIFLSTAKLRAMRVLWAKLCESAGQSPETKILAKMSFLDLAMKDPETNMLRATAATVAAGLGTADALVLLPFTSAHGIAAAGARRLALNTQIIAQEESHIGSIEDPAAGSWYVESLTQELAATAWDYFRKTEQGGGMAKMLRSGAIRKMIEPVSHARELDVATGKHMITGLNLFPNVNEKAPDLASEKPRDENHEAPDTELSQEEIPHLKAPGKGDRFKDIAAKIKDGLPFLNIEEALEGPQSLITMVGNINNRLATNIEQLRSVSDYIKVETGRRPSVFLANLGRPSDFTARATWSKSYFETGGIEAISNDGFKDLDEMVAAFTASGARIACLCSSDEAYKDSAITTAKALKEAGAHGVYMVAKPEILKAIPTEDHTELHAVLYKGTDIVLTLMEAHYLIGPEDENLMI